MSLCCVFVNELIVFVQRCVCVCVFEVISAAMKHRNGAKFTETECRKILFLFNYLLGH